MGGGLGSVAEPPTFLRFVTSKNSWCHRTGRIVHTDFSVQPRIPEAATPYCTSRANFAQQRRTAIVENYVGILISQLVINRVIGGCFWVMSNLKTYC